MYTVPQTSELFAEGSSPLEIAQQFEAYKAALSDAQFRSYQSAKSGASGFEFGKGIVTGSPDPVSQLREQMTNKSLSPDVVASMESALEQIESINKDFTLTNPLNSGTGPNPSTFGLVPYDLDPALAFLVPRAFILRNQIVRESGVGQAYEYRRITGLSNSGVGGVANLSTFFASTSANTTFKNVGLQRPGKIQYTADRHVVSAVEQGLSDAVDMQAQFAGTGYTDVRQLSHTALLYAHMLGEERNMLGARGTGSGYVGALGTPSVGTAASSTGGSLANSTTYYMKVTYSTAMGETVASAEFSQATAGGGTALIVTPNANIPAAALGVNVYIGAVSGTYTAKYSGTYTVTCTAVSVGTYTAPSSDASASALAYDGMLSVFTDPTQSGYVKRLNAALSTTEPGAELQAAFGSLFTSVLGDPESVLMSAAIRKELSAAVQQQGNPTGYRLNYNTGSDGMTIGALVTAIQNEYTGTMVDLVAHPYLPAGAALIWQKQLPFPDSGVSNTISARNTQDLMILEWPVIQMSYDISSYAYGSLLFKAPAWCGAITGIL